MSKNNDNNNALFDGNGNPTDETCELRLSLEGLVMEFLEGRKFDIVELRALHSLLGAGIGLCISECILSEQVKETKKRKFTFSQKPTE
jgi:hypothetical protein